MMSEDKSDIEKIKNKIISTKAAYEKSAFVPEEDMTFEWSAVSAAHPKKVVRSGESRITPLGHNAIEFSGKKLAGGQFADENLEDANFSCADLEGINFAGANLRGVDFSGANLTGADLSEADLSGANFSGAILKNANFTNAVMKGVKLSEADIEGAIFLGIRIDELTMEELQELIEYLAKYYPEKLNLSLLNLTLLDLSKIDLSKVSLRGVDFTGCDLTGVNIMELDLSSCIITPEQIAQALGRVPSALELKKILAPKTKPKKKGWNIDFDDFFHNKKEFGVIDTRLHKGTSVAQIMKSISNVAKKMGYGQAPEPTGEEILQQMREEKSAKSADSKEELRRIIEENKRETLMHLEQEKKQQRELPREQIREEKQSQKQEPTSEIMVERANEIEGQKPEDKKIEKPRQRQIDMASLSKMQDSRSRS